jgi:hypothetical protein
MSHEKIYIPMLLDFILSLMCGAWMRQIWYGETAQTSTQWGFVYVESLFIGISLFFVIRLTHTALNLYRYRNAPEWKRDRLLMKIALYDYLSNLAAAAIIVGILMVAGAQLLFKF